MCPTVDRIQNDGAGSFHKASCTLSASVMIYSCRVDDVHQDTFRVLGGLTRADRKDEKKTEDVKDEDGLKKKKKITALQQGATLESNPSNLSVRQFDIRFDVDPLFAKTSAAFDEGGARGLLLGHLSVLPTGALASDGADPAEIPPVFKSPGKMITSKISLPWSVAEPLFNADQLKICPPLATFSFTQPDDQIEPIPQTDIPALDVEDDYAEMDDGPMMMMIGGSDDAARLEAGLQRRLLEEAADGDAAVDVVPGPAVPGAMDFEMVMAAATRSLGQHSGDYHFVDPKLLLNWAGPSHWKFAPLPRAETDGTAKATRAKKEPFAFSFTTQPPVDTQVAFAPAVGRATTVLSAAMMARTGASAASLLLPVDLHYSTQELTRLFSQPLWTAAHIQKRDGDGVEDAGDWYEYDNPGDAENFVPEVAADDDDDEIAPQATELDVLQVPRKVEQIQIDYAKHAKQVNVQRLKEGIWGQIKKDPAPQSFQDVVESLPSALPSSEMRDVSVPFCFICLLHLANEKGLEIRDQDDLKDLSIVVPS